MSNYVHGSPYHYSRLRTYKRTRRPSNARNETLRDDLHRFRLRFSRAPWPIKITMAIGHTLAFAAFGFCVFVYSTFIINHVCWLGSYVYHEYYDSTWYVHMSAADHYDWYFNGPDAVPTDWRQDQ